MEHAYHIIISIHSIVCSTVSFSDSFSKRVRDTNINYNNNTKISPQIYAYKKCRVQQDFRLHQAAVNLVGGGGTGSGSQSNAVSRINSMFLGEQQKQQQKQHQHQLQTPPLRKLQPPTASSDGVIEQQRSPANNNNRNNYCNKGLVVVAAGNDTFPRKMETLQEWSVNIQRIQLLSYHTNYLNLFDHFLQ